MLINIAKRRTINITVNANNSSYPNNSKLKQIKITSIQQQKIFENLSLA
jgi:hypothetical protein